MSDENKRKTYSIHLLTGYEGNNTFIVPKVPTPRTIVGEKVTIKVL